MNVKTAKRIEKSFNEYNGKNQEILDELYHPKVVFEDPITRVEGLSDLKEYYQHAYANVKSIRFDFTNMIESENTFTCEWNMHLHAKMLNFGREVVVKGVSVLTFDKETSKIIRHRDYLDLGEMVYEQIPGIGSVIKLLKKQLS